MSEGGAGAPAAAGGATQGEASGELRTEVVARVTGAVHFGGLADFQYVSCDPRPPSEQVCSCFAGAGGIMHGIK